MKNNFAHLFAYLAIFALLLQTTPTQALPISTGLETIPASIGLHEDSSDPISMPGYDFTPWHPGPGLPESIVFPQEGLHQPAEERVYIPPTAVQLALTAAHVRSFACSTVTDVPQVECEALVALYASTNGDGWGNSSDWLGTTTVGNWYGVTVSAGHVSHLSLYYNYLSGSIPPELGNLSGLVALYLFSNQLSGSIPPVLGNLSSLEYLDLHSNQLIGGIPSALGNLSNLQDLSLAFNQLSGNIPPELGILSSLTYLNLTDNQLSGSIPLALGNLSNLEFLYLDNNQLSGNIPPVLGILSNLEFLCLNDNQLSGSIPPALGNLSSLVYLSLNDNPLIGSVPPSFVNLSSLSYFHYYETSLCEPNTPEFLVWKASVGDWQGTDIICLYSTCLPLIIR